MCKSGESQWRRIFGGIVGKTETSSTGHISNCYYNMDAITGGFDVEQH